MIKIEDFVGIATKKNGDIEYQLWVNEAGALYIQITKNNTKITQPGTHSKCIFRISDFLEKKLIHGEIQCLNPETFEQVQSKNRNDVGFVRNALKQLFPTE